MSRHMKKYKNGRTPGDDISLAIDVILKSPETDNFLQVIDINKNYKDEFVILVADEKDTERWIHRITTEEADKNQIAW